MKFNSQICTTKEQSERLLALGLKKETADMCYKVTIHDFTGKEINEKERHYILCCWYNESNQVCGLERKVTIPAWSLHRLIEIYGKTCIFWTDCLDNPYEAMIGRIADKIKWRELNKEYLEE